MKKRIFPIITIIIAAAIFFQSTLNGTESAVESDAAFGLLDRLTSFLRLPNFLNGMTIRKFAHFTEFAVFGFFLSATVYVYCRDLKKMIYKILFFILAVPVMDEFIQSFSEGRTAKVMDILIDFSGGLFGLFCCWAMTAVLIHIKRKKDKSC